MRTKTIVNGKGEPQITQIEIQIEGAGGELGMQAIKNLTTLISRFKHAKTGYDVLQHFYKVEGYAICCRDCGFLTEESTTRLLQMAERLADNELTRIGENLWNK